MLPKTKKRGTIPKTLKKGEIVMKKLIIAVICMSFILVGANAYAQQANANADVNAEAVYAPTDNSVNTSNVYDRKFVNPGVYPFPQTNGFFTAPTPDSSFRSVKELLKFFADGDIYMIRISEGALKELASGGKTKMHIQIVRGEKQVARYYTKSFKGEKWLWLGIEEPAFDEAGNIIGTKRVAGTKVTGMIDGETKDGHTNSFHVIGKAGLKALKDGNNVMILTAEGAHRMVQATGWGIGTAATGGLVNETGKEAIVGGGGTGYSNNKSMTEDKPWIQGYVGVNMTYELPEGAVEETAAVNPQTGNHTAAGSIQDQAKAAPVAAPVVKEAKVEKETLKVSVVEYEQVSDCINCGN